MRLLLWCISDRMLEWCSERRWTGLLAYVIIGVVLPLGWPFIIGLLALIFVDVRSYVEGMNAGRNIWRKI